MNMEQSTETTSNSPIKGDLLRMILLVITLVADQVTKYLARLHFGLPGGEPDYFKIKQVLGEWIQFRLVFNSGAAFGMKPQSIIPFLNPTLFYTIFSTVAIVALIYYYRHLRPQDLWQKAGLTLILSGAFGNLIDRLRFHKVTDFIDVGVPAWPTRWPTFNVADSCVCIGVGLIIIAPMFIKNRAPSAGS
jgi:signal peptidase II